MLLFCCSNLLDVVLLSAFKLSFFFKPLFHVHRVLKGVHVETTIQQSYSCKLQVYIYIKRLTVEQWGPFRLQCLSMTRIINAGTQSFVDARCVCMFTQHQHDRSTAQGIMKLHNDIAVALLNQPKANAGRLKKKKNRLRKKKGRNESKLFFLKITTPQIRSQQRIHPRRSPWTLCWTSTASRHLK